MIMRREQKARLRAMSVFPVLLLLVLLSACPVSAADDTDVILDGVFIGNIDVSGMTATQAEEAVRSYMDEVSGYHINLVAGDSVVSVTAAELGLVWKNGEVVEEALAFGQSGNLVERYKAQKDLEEGDYHFELEYGVDEEMTAAVLEEQSASLNHDPQDASMTTTSSGLQIISAKDGVAVRTDEAVEAIVTYLTEEWRTGVGEVELPADTEAAEHTATELETIQDLLGEASTDYSSSNESRIQNITRGAELLNDMVIYPGESVAVTELVVPFTEENGYTIARSYASGTVVESYGGGICQVTSTLYMALLNAEIEITERHNHSIMVSYVEPSMDAAIAEGYKDMQFVNNLDTPIYIHIYLDGENVVAQIYGQEYRAENRTVTYESEILETIEATTVEITATDEAFGTVTETSSAYTGYEACLWKIVTVDGVETSREEINYSSYSMAPATYTVGTTTSNETAKAALEAAIASNDLSQVYQVISTYS